MPARFKVNICKSKVEISPSHNDNVEWKRGCWLKEVGSCYCHRMGWTNGEMK
jgi:hypothetical protein